MTLESPVLGKYKIIRELGRSNDIVYEAIDTTINRRVALKELLLPPNLSGAQKRERIERFYREARAAGSLSHPNIVTIYEVGEDHGRHYIAMEFLEGQSLRDILDIEHTLPIDKAISIAIQICDALDYAHQKGVIHRDIKPDNIQILEENRVKITDFGIARIMDEPSITMDGQVFGTPSYMSPEQVAGKPIDQRSDIFSLGVVLYEMLTGRKPFTGDSVVSITYSIMNQDVIIPPGIPPQLERILRKCLAKDPNNRYQSVRELADDLRLYLNGDQSAPVPTMQMAVNTAIDPQNVTIAQTDLSTSPPTQSQPSLFSLDAYKKHHLSDQSLYFVKLGIIVLLISGALIGFILLLVAGYNGFKMRENIEQTNAYLHMAQQYFDQKSYQAAIDEFNKALQSTKDPSIIKVIRHNMAICYLELGNQMSEQGYALQAINYYQQAILLDPNFAEAYLNLGIELRNIGNDDEAINAWTKAAQVGYGSRTAQLAKEYIAIIYYERGELALKGGNKDLAIEWWKSAIETAPGTQVGMMAQRRIDQFLGS